MKYDPNNELSELELEKLSNDNFDEFLNYLDQKSEYLKSKTRKLNSYEIKKFASISKAFMNDSLTEDEMIELRKMGKRNEMENNEKFINGK